MKVIKYAKRVSIIFFCSLFLFVVVITTTSYKTKAVVPAVAVGVAALASFLTAAGVSLSAQNIANNATMSDTLNDIANQYSSSSGAPTLEDTIATKDALNYYYNNEAGEAFVSMSDSVSQWMLGFKNWFVNNFALTDSGESIVISDKKFTTYDGQSYLYYTDFSSFVNGKVPVSSIPLSTDPVIVNCKQGYYLVIQGYEDGYQYYYYRPGVRVQGFDPLGNLVFSNGHRYASETPNNFSFIKVCFTFDSRYNTFAINSLPTDAGDYSSGGYGFSLNGFLTLTDVTTSEIGLSGSLTDGYDDFEQALSDARSDAGENGQIAIGVGDVAVERPYTQEGIAEGILDNVITNTGEGTLVGGYTDEKEVEEETDSEKVPTYAEIGKNIVLVDGLEDFFPFCIPFDLIAMIRKFDVEPEAPVIHWNMSFANVFDSEEMTLDFSPWENAALIFRICCLIGFSIFLILKTRDIIRG